MSRLPSRHALLVTVVAVLTCGREPSVPDVLATVPSWSLSDATAIDIPDASPGGEYAFSDVSGVVRFRDGRFVLAGNNQLVFFDAAGRLAHTQGGSGQGPGEFQFLIGVELCRGDTVVAYEAMRPVLSLFTSTGRFVRSVMPAPPSGLLPGRFVGCLPTGYAMSYALPGPPIPPSAPGTATRRSAVVHGASALGDPRDELFRFAGMEEITGLRRPFGRQTLIGVTPAAIWLADNADAVIYRLGVDGRVLDSATVKFAAQPVTEADRAQQREFYLKGVSPAVAQRDIIPRLDMLEWPTTMPQYSRVLVAPDGGLWVGAYGPNRAPPMEWEVFTRTGRHVANLTVPEDFELAQVDSTFVVGLLHHVDETVSAQVRAIVVTPVRR